MTPTPSKRAKMDSLPSSKKKKSIVPLTSEETELFEEAYHIVKNRLATNMSTLPYDVARSFVKLTALKKAWMDEVSDLPLNDPLRKVLHPFWIELEFGIYMRFNENDNPTKEEEESIYTFLKTPAVKAKLREELARQLKFLANVYKKLEFKQNPFNIFRENREESNFLPKPNLLVYKRKGTGETKEFWEPDALRAVYYYPSTHYLHVLPGENTLQDMIKNWNENVNVVTMFKYRVPTFAHIKDYKTEKRMLVTHENFDDDLDKAALEPDRGVVNIKATISKIRLFDGTCISMHYSLLADMPNEECIEI